VTGTVPPAPSRVPWWSAGQRSNTKNPSATARPAVGIFFPQRLLLRLDSHGYSPAILEQIISAGAELKSFQLAQRMLAKLAGVHLCARHVGRLTEAIGQELCQYRDDQAAQLPLHSRRAEQAGYAPAVVAVEVDGGRIHTRAPGCGRGIHDPHWKEDKIACLLTLHSQPRSVDPHPEVPACFLDRPRVARLVQEISNQRATSDDPLVLPTAAVLPAVPDPAVPTVAAPPPADPAPATPKRWQPERLVRTCVATMHNSDTFGKLVASEAYQRHFYGATRRAFVADGSHYNWALQQRHFADFEPITDFIHVLSYVYAAAYATAQAGWATFERWLRACWRGKVAEVIAELNGWLEAQAPLADGVVLAKTEPREIARQTLGYLLNNAGRMDYPRYRCLGLPCVSAWMESLVKEFNYRVKGSEKFWCRGDNAEAILQARAAVLSEDERLSQHLARRAGSPFRAYRHKQTVAQRAKSKKAK